MHGLITVVALAVKLRSVAVSFSLDNPSCNYSIIACLVTNRGINFSKAISLPWTATTVESTSPPNRL